MGFRRLGKVFLLGIFLSLTGLLLVIAGIILWSITSEKEVQGRFGVVIDAGGSGTKLSVFEERNNNGITEIYGVKCEEKGIASYISNVTLIDKKLNDCLKNAEATLPSQSLGSISLYFGATGGMRMLKKTDPTSYSKILDEVRKVLKQSSLKFKGADVLEGQDEGIYGWVSLNYLENGLASGGERSQSIEMGSTSAQVAFQTTVDKSKLSKEIKTVKVLGNDYSVYSHSYLCLGRNEFGRRYYASLATAANYNTTIDDPCHFKGDTQQHSSEYLWKEPCSKGSFAKNTLGQEFTGPANKIFTFNGISDPAKCIAVVQKLLLKTSCGYTHCGVNGVKQPKPTGLFTAFAAMYYPVAFMGLKSDVSGKDYLAATKKICKKDFAEVKKMSTFTPKYSRGYCLSSVYSYLLLTHGLGFNSDKWDVNFKSKVKGKKISWKLGLQISHENAMSKPITKMKHDYSKELYNVLFAGGTMILVMGILCLGVYIAIRVKEKEMLGTRFVKDEESTSEAASTVVANTV